jgi:riboflavin biosynthesis pyrimidine reductase
MPIKRGSAACRPTARLCAALTFDGKLCLLPIGAVSAVWEQLQADLCARSDALLVHSSAPSNASPATLPVVRVGVGAKTDISSLLEKLRAIHGVKNLLCLGGPRLFRALLERDLADELHLLICPQVGGGRSQPTLSGLPGEFFPRSIPWRLRRLEIIGEGCRMEYHRKKPAA